jgi:exonuclease SbcC
MFARKPRWLSKDASTRLLGVLHDNESDLVATLGRIAREDEDAKIRIAAMKRLADPGIVQGVAHDDADPGARVQARALWLDLLTGTHASSPSLVERVRLLKAQDDNELIEHIARRAREPELRRAALERITRASVLFDRALEDPDAQIRVGLVERIDDEAQLARLAERARKSDKQVSRRAKERIEALRISRGDDVTLDLRARSLCEQLEQLVRQPRHAEAEAAITGRWADVEAAASESLRVRFNAAQALLAISRNPPPKPEVTLIEPVALAPVVEPSDVVAVEMESSDGSSVEPLDADDKVIEITAPLIAQARFAASLDEANAERKQQRERQQILLGQLKESLEAIDTAIEGGMAAQAHAARRKVDSLRRQLDAPLPPALAQYLMAVEARYAELSRWQHWADNQRRRQLLEDIETLPTSGLHPDAVATRVRDAQLEWTRLDAIEGSDASGPGGFARQFHAACRAALAPTQAYFRKRQELRQSHAKQVADLLERVTALGEDTADWPAIATLRSETVDALRGLDSVEPRERKVLAQRLKDSLTHLDARVARRDTEVERIKSALIVEAERLGEGTPQRGAAGAARELQQRWQRSGNGRRSRDQAQWTLFRAAIDAVFAKLDAERNERSARDTEELTQAQALCAEMESLGEADTSPERGVVARVQSAWNALRVREEDLIRRFGDAQNRLQDASSRRERARRHAHFDAWRVRYRLCRIAEQSPERAEDLRAQWENAPAGAIATPELSARFETAFTTDVAHDVAIDDDYRDVLIGIEVLGGVESPQDDVERRRALQVVRLSARLRNASAAVPPEQELATLLTQWTMLRADADADERLERALATVLETLP